MGSVFTGMGASEVGFTGGAGSDSVDSLVVSLLVVFLVCLGWHRLGAVMVDKVGCTDVSMMVARGVGWAGVGVGAQSNFLASSSTLRDVLSRDMTCVNNSEVLMRACTCVGSSGGSEWSCNGFHRIQRMSCRVARMRLELLTIGRGTLVRNHSRVLQMHSMRVSQIHTR